MNENENNDLMVEKLGEIVITPTTKRLGMICLALIAMAAIAGATFGKIDIDKALLIVLPTMTAISAVIDGGK